MLGINPVLVTLTLNDEEGEAVVLVPAPLVESQGPVVADPGREPQYSRSRLGGGALSLSEKQAPDMLAGERLLNVQAQELGLLAGWSQFVSRTKGDLSKANEVSVALRDDYLSGVTGDCLRKHCL